jgi:transketolase
MEIAKSEDVAARYEAYGWHVQSIDWRKEDGSYVEDMEALYDALLAAKAETGRPSMIKLRLYAEFGLTSERVAAVARTALDRASAP